MKQKTVSMFRIFPMKAITLALLITLAGFGVAGWHIWKSYKGYKTALSQDYKFQFLINSLNSGSTMTMIVRTAVKTGSLEEENVYNYLAKEVDEAIKEINKIAPDSEIRGILHKMNKTNSRLIEIEKQVFELVRQDRLEEANNLVNGKEYKDNLNEFDASNYELAESLRMKVENEVFSLRKRAFFAFAVIVGAIPVLVFVWIVVLGMMRKYLMERSHQECIKAIIASLEQKLSIVSTPNEAALAVIQAADELFGLDASYVVLYDEEKDDFSSVVYFDVIDGKRQQIPSPPKSSERSFFLRLVLAEGPRIILRQSTEDDTKYKIIPFGDVQRLSRSLMFVPIRKGEKNVGVISIQSYTRNVYDKSDLDLFQILADHCSGALHRTVTEIQLFQSEEKLRLLTEQIPALLWTTDKDLRFTLLRGAGLRALDLDPGKHIGKTLHAIFHDRDLSLPSISMHKTALQGLSANYEMRLMGKFFDSYVEPLHNAVGDVIGCICVAHDITERKYAEEALKKFNMAIEQIANSVIIYDHNLTIEYVNRAFENITGYSKREIIGKTHRILVADDQKPHLYEQILKTVQSGSVYGGVVVKQKKNGELYHDETMITPLKDIHGVITHFVETGKDITERIRAEEELRQAHEELERRVEERTAELSLSNSLLRQEITERKRAEQHLAHTLSLYRATLESTTDGILVADKNGNFLNCNHKFIQMWNFPLSILEKQEFLRIGDSISQALKNPERFREKLSTLSHQPTNAESFDVLELKNSQIFECYSKPQHLDNECVGRVWSFRDVTERKKGEQALERSEAIYREAIENASGVPYRFLYGQESYEFMGKEIFSLIGYSPDEFSFPILEQCIQEIIILDPDAPKEHIEYVRAFRRGELDQYRVDLRIKTREGEHKWISDCSVPIRDESSGKVIGSLGILQDITKRKKVEEQARIQQERLIHADKMVSLGILVSGVAHEINNPNNFIMLNTPILLESWESLKPILEQYYDNHGDFVMGGLNYSEMREHIPVLFSGIVEGSKRIKNIVQELRDFTRQYPAELKENVNINDIVNSALTLLSNMIKKTTDNFKVSYGTDLPSISGNFQRLEQVLINLIQNACQALPDRNSIIFVSTSFDQNEDSIIVQVKDEGVGIHPEMLKHIMDPFFTTKRDSGGTGLGLSISANIVNEHGGKLLISSEKDKGTTVSVILPLKIRKSPNNN